MIYVQVKSALVEISRMIVTPGNGSSQAPATTAAAPQGEHTLSPFSTILSHLLLLLLLLLLISLLLLLLLLLFSLLFSLLSSFFNYTRLSCLEARRVCSNATVMLNLTLLG